MNRTGKMILSAVLLVLCILFIVLIKSFDVAAIGPQDTAVGFSHLNQAFHNWTGTNMLWYRITEICGYLAILLALGFVALGAVQLFTRRSFMKVDPQIYAIGGLLVAIAVLYVLFEKVIINYRPIIMPGDTEPEASFPSSHTMLSCCVFGGALLLLPKYCKGLTLRIGQIVLSVLLVITVVGRLVSGVHWLTDIMGGVLISLFLLSVYEIALEQINSTEKTKGKRK